MSSSTSSSTFRVAAVQSEPCWLDVDAGVEKACKIIKEAAANGAQLVGFPECWIPGFPHCLFTGPPNPAWQLKYQKNSIALNSPQHNKLRLAAREAGVWVIMGFSEREKASIYMAQSFISPTGEVALHRRKFKPTHAERYLWGDASGDSLDTTITTDDGVVIGGLNCWEHVQPLLRYHSYSKGMQIHVGSWPHLCPAAEGVPYSTTGDMSGTAVRFLALEGSCFAMCCTAVTSKEGSAIMNVVDTGDIVAVPIEGGGFTAIYGPDGRVIAKADTKAETILYADLDLDECLIAKQMADPVGHYSRPELLSLNVNNTRHTTVRYADGSHEKTLTQTILPLP